MNLLGHVPRRVDLQQALRLENGLWVVGALRNGRLALVDADDILDDLAGCDRLPLLEHGLCDLHVRLALGVRVVVRRLCERLGDDVLLDAELIVLDLLGDAAQVLEDLRDELLAVHPREDEIKHHRSRLAGERAPVAAHEVEAFCLARGGQCAVAVLLHHQRGVLFFLEEQHRLHEAIHVDLHAAIVLVDLALELVGHLLGLLEVSRHRVHHDRVGVTVDDLHRVVV